MCEAESLQLAHRVVGLAGQSRQRARSAVWSAPAFAVRGATLSTAAAGIRTFDLGGEASTSEVVEDVVARVRRELGGSQA